MMPGENNMAGTAKSALLLQGGGALGAYELGAARALYKDPNFSPDLIAGVSIGAVTAVLLARPKKPMERLAALEAFWEKVTVRAPFFPDLVRPYASFLGNPNFFTPRRDYLSFFNWTYFYETEPLRRTLQELIDLNALRDKTALPRLLVSATDLTEGQIEYFYSDSPDYELTLDHIMASGSLPPAFDMTPIGNKSYWDGGLFDNTPLGAVLDHLNDAPDVDRTVYVVNLFPNKAAVPKNMPEVVARMKDLQFANKSLEDVKLLKRFNEVAALMQALESLPNGNPLEDHPAYRAVKDRGYLRVPRIVSIIPPEATTQFGDADFSPEAINERADRGEEQTLKALEQPSKSPRRPPKIARRFSDPA
jgi:NTE family protein